MSPKTLPMHATKNDLPGDTRSEMVTLLNARLADMADWSMQLKQAHWNIKGPEFIAIHEMLDTMYTESAAFVDDIAERAVQLGGQAVGTVQATVRNTSLPEFPVDETSQKPLLTALVASASAIATNFRKALDAADEAADKNTAGMLNEMSMVLDKQLWFLEAHLG